MLRSQPYRSVMTPCCLSCLPCRPLIPDAGMGVLTSMKYGSLMKPGSTQLTTHGMRNVPSNNSSLRGTGQLLQKSAAFEPPD